MKPSPIINQATLADFVGLPRSRITQYQRLGLPHTPAVGVKGAHEYIAPLAVNWIIGFHVLDDVGHKSLASDTAFVIALGHVSGGDNDPIRTEDLLTQLLHMDKQTAREAVTKARGWWLGRTGEIPTV